MDPERVEEFTKLVKEKEAPATRSWVIWMNETYRINCRLAQKDPDFGEES